MNARVSVCLCVSAAVLAAGLAPAGADPVTFTGLVDQTIQRDLLTQYPDGAWTLQQASSYNRLSVATNQAGWYTNPDRSNFIRLETNQGRTEAVMMEDTGPGAITRWWMGGQLTLGNLRVYIDGSTTPSLIGLPTEVVGGAGTGVFDDPWAAVRAQGRNLYAPITYSTSIKVTYDGPNNPAIASQCIWYDINYRKYTPGTNVQSFVPADVTTYQSQLTTVGSQLLSPSTASRGTGNVTYSHAQFVDPGQAVRRVLFSGGAVKRFRVNLTATDMAAALENTYVEMTFDGEKTVSVPVGQFFGTGRAINPYTNWYATVEANGDMTAYWTMPYQSNADIRIVNRGSQSVGIDMDLETGAYTWGDKSMYFHSEYRRQSDLRSPQDWNYTRIRGQGVYVGDSLTVNKNYTNWWGEGDEKIYVDGAAFPTHYGTGSEDYYGYAYGASTTFSHPFVGQPTGAGNSAVGTSVNLRTRALDTVPFTQSLKVDMECYQNNAYLTSDYAMATQWYGRPGTTSHFAALADAGANFRTATAGQTPAQAGMVDSAGDGQWACLASDRVNASEAGANVQSLTWGVVGDAGHSGFGGGLSGSNLPAVSNQTIFTTGESLRTGELAMVPAGTSDRPYLVTRWIAGPSSAGEVNIYGSIRHTLTTGDGIDFWVLVDGQVRWSLDNYAVRLSEVFFDLDATVAAGSVVDFVLGNGGAGNFTGDESILQVKIGRFTPLYGAGVPGDANFDGKVDLQDFSLLKANYSATGRQWYDGNFNGDDIVDLQDFSLLKANYNRTPSAAPAAIPEPATLSLLVLALLPALRRRR